jgi:uncharacterized DUF497 family protein
MEYEWDSQKAAANLIKHGVAFDSAAGFDWTEALIEEDDRYFYGERRFYALSHSEGRLHAMIFARRENVVRIISFRRANARERRRYENR